MKKTKITATIGPASEKTATLKKMMEAGMDVCRLNFSHGEQAWHKKTVKNIRKASKEAGKSVGIIADIQGPRIRVANKRSLKLEKKEKVFVTDENCPHTYGFKKELILDWDSFYQYAEVGEKIFIEDGLKELETIDKKKDGCVAEVITGGKVDPHKGVNIPKASSHMGFLTDKDIKDLEFIIPQGVDFVAASFVSNRKQLQGLKQHIKRILKKEKNFHKMEKGSQQTKNSSLAYPWIVSKIETRKAIQNLDAIIDESDAIMVARGDLAIEMPQEEVVVLQKKIVNKCLKAKKPVIVATQMFASMVEKPRPTRAEISDVTNAVVDCADSIMFSNETAVGKYPLKTIETAARVIQNAEKSPYNDKPLKKLGKFAKIITRLRKQKKSGKEKTISIAGLGEAKGYSALRQEDVHLKLKTKDKNIKRKGSLIWGIE
ncbi:MAG: pyruvate kinase [Candidatus Moranbacteria bacterium]|nr:pyruvate kinase [Candidatus Moranbacteria bacterium]